MTYNHSAYITDAMDGFCLQKTHFPYVCGILDDASTDGEQEVLFDYIKENFDIFCHGDNEQEETEDYIRIIAQNKKNKNCFFVVVLMKYNHYQIKKTKYSYVSEWFNKAKYIAICEGDDYWVDPFKLQKQVNYMESHSDCSLCFTGAKVIFDNGFEEDDNKEYKALYRDLEERDYDGIELLKKWILPTASILRRNDYTIKSDKRFMFSDIIIGLSAAENGKVHCIAEDMVVYRRNSNGLSVKRHPLSRRIIHYATIAETFGDKYNEICESLIIGNIASYILTGDKEDRKYAIKVLKDKPMYVPKVCFAIMTICVNVLKRRFLG